MARRKLSPPVLSLSFSERPRLRTLPGAAKQWSRGRVLRIDRRSRAHRSTAATATRILLRIKKTPRGASFPHSVTVAGNPPTNQSEKLNRASIRLERKTTGAVVRKRASTVRMVGTRFEFGIAPPLGGNLLLAGELRRMAKPHRPGGPAGGLRAGRYPFGQTPTLRPRFGRAERQNRGRPPRIPALASDPPTPNRLVRLGVSETVQRRRSGHLREPSRGGGLSGLYQAGSRPRGDRGRRSRHGDPERKDLSLPSGFPRQACSPCGLALRPHWGSKDRAGAGTRNRLPRIRRVRASEDLAAAERIRTRRITFKQFTVSRPRR